MKNNYKIEGDVVHIFIERKDGSNYTALVDLEDLPKISKAGSWFVNEYKPGSVRVWGRIKLKEGEIGEQVYLHRYLMDFPEGMLVDHINNDALDNRRCNLRLATKSENAQNYKGARADNQLGVLGVCYNKRQNSYVAAVHVKGKRVLKYFKTLEEAAEAAKEMRKEHMPYSKEAMEGGT